MNAQHISLGAVGALVLAVLAVGALAGTGAATVETNETNFVAVGNDTLSNQTLTVTNDTRSIYVELDNSTGGAPEPVNVTVFGIDDGGNETQVDKVQISAAANSTEMYEFTAIDTSTYSEYRVLVEGNGSAIASTALDVGTVKEVSGGGGLLGGSGVTGSAALGVLVIAGIILFARD